MSDTLPKPSVGQETTPQEQQHGNNRSRFRAPVGCCTLSHDGLEVVKGVSYGGVARGAISMSNVYLANALIHLACKASGGFDETGTYCENPNINIYGMKPFALVSNIAVIASILAALFMPPFGAIIDYTPYRKYVGIGSAIGLVLITGVQVATIDDTWFIMAILQCIIFMIYQIQLMAVFAYFPEIARDVGEEKFYSYSSTWSLLQFLSQASVNLIIIIAATYGKLGTVYTSMFSQGIVFTVCAISLTMCWKMIPHRPRKHRLPKGHSLVVAAFRQNYTTAKKIWKHYDMGLRWFYISTIFGEASASAVGTTAVVFLTGNLQLSASQIGIFFEVSLVGVIFGTKIGELATKFTDPKISLILSEAGLALSVAIGVWSVQGVEVKELTYMWGFSIGIFLGWFYPTENVFFAMTIPKNQETELSGFLQYCSEIFGWFPPLIFSIMVQNNISLAWALTVVASIFSISIAFLLLCGPWETMVEQSETIEMDFSPDFGSSGNVELSEAIDTSERKNNENAEPEKVEAC